MLIAMAGLPATGKSFLAQQLAEKTDGVVIGVDDIEDCLAAAGLWRNEATKTASYEAAGQVVSRNLALGHHVIVDAPNADTHSRTLWTTLASAHKTNLLFLITTCSDSAEHLRRVGLHRLNPDGTGLTWQQVIEQNVKTVFWGSEPRLAVDTSHGVDIDRVVETIAGFSGTSDFAASYAEQPAPRRAAL